MSRNKINYQCYLLGQRRLPHTRPLKVYHSTAEYNLELFEETGKLFPCRVGPEFIAKDLQSVDHLINIMGYLVVDIRQVVSYIDASDVVPDPFDPNHN